MIKFVFLFIATLSICLSTSGADARPHHAQHHHTAATPTPIVCDLRGCSDRVTARPQAAARNAFAAVSPVDANGNEAVIGGRPSGCPYEFCGCEASRYVFGEIRRELNLASA